MDTVESFLKDVELEADQRSIEVLFRLLDRLERMSGLSVEEALRYYVGLKLSRHHLRKQWYRGWTPWRVPSMTEEEYALKYNNLTNRIVQARRNYYVTKQRSAVDGG